MPQLVITRGLPGSGKTTWARAEVANDPFNWVRVNRDDLRAMLNDSKWKKEWEFDVVAARDAMVGALLARGINVIVDDTNLPLATVIGLQKVAQRHGAEFRIQDFTDVPLATALERNALRNDKLPIPSTAIETMYREHIQGRIHSLDTEALAHAPDIITHAPAADLPECILVDIDGTLALRGDRYPFDESKVEGDKPNKPVIDTVVALWNQGVKVVIISGRRDSCQPETERWLTRELPVEYTALYMRSVAEEGFPDYQVKARIFDQHIRNHYRVKLVIDDRTQVVRLWRQLGLTALQCAEGHF